MFDHVIVIFYNFAVFCGICNLSLTGLLIYKQRSKTLEKLFIFLIFFFIYGLLNMILYYRVHIIVASSIMPYYAALITVSYTLMNCQWTDHIIQTCEEKNEISRKCLYAVCGVCILIWVIDGLVFMDDQLNVVNKAGNAATTIAECVVLVAMIVFCIEKLYKKHKHFYQTAETVLVLVFFTYITIKDVRISFFGYNLETYSLSSWSFCAVFCFLTNVLTLIYLVGLFKNFIEEARHDKKEIHLLELTLEEIKEKYGISEREMDVLVLIYKGKNNGKIAEELFISGNTVKKHINSIFRKLQVSSRAEIISKIRLKNL